MNAPLQVRTEALAPAIDLAAIKAAMKATWMDGDYARFCVYMEPGAREILAGWGIRAGERLLDVACGAGQITIPAAEAGVDATGVDIASNLIEAARERARRAGVSVRFDEGDAEALPYADGEFDVVTSLIGAMFAPRPERTAAELARVCRPGGRLHMGNWRPTGLAADLFRCVARYRPPPAGVPSPVLWGDEATVRERLGPCFQDLTLARREFPRWAYPFGVAETVEHYRRYFGPVKRVFAALDAGGQAALRRDLEALFSAYNRADDGTTVLHGEYLDVTAVRRGA